MFIIFLFSLQLHNFKRHLAQLIGDTDDSVPAEEDAIVSKVKNLSRHYRDLKAVGVNFFPDRNTRTRIAKSTQQDRTVKLFLAFSVFVELHAIYKTRSHLYEDDFPFLARALQKMSASKLYAHAQFGKFVYTFFDLKVPSY